MENLRYTTFKHALETVSQNGMELKNMAMEYRVISEIAIAALKQNSDSLIYINVGLLNDPIFVKSILDDEILSKKHIIENLAPEVVQQAFFGGKYE